MLKLGYVEADITPSESMPLMGFNRSDNVSRGVLKPLRAQVSVWEGEEYWFCDVKYLSDRLRMKVGIVLRLP